MLEHHRGRNGLRLFAPLAPFALLAILFLFPLTSFAQTYTSFAITGQRVIGLATDGFAYHAATISVDSWGQWPSGSPGAGVLPGQSIPMSQLLAPFSPQSLAGCGLQWRSPGR